MHCDWFILPLLLLTLTIWFSLDRKQWSHKRSWKKMEKIWFFLLRFLHTLLMTQIYYFHWIISALTTVLTTPMPTLSLVKLAFRDRKPLIAISWVWVVRRGNTSDLPTHLTNIMWFFLSGVLHETEQWMLCQRSYTIGSFKWYFLKHPSNSSTPQRFSLAKTGRKDERMVRLFTLHTCFKLPMLRAPILVQQASTWL